MPKTYQRNYYTGRIRHMTFQPGEYFADAFDKTVTAVSQFVSTRLSRILGTSGIASFYLKDRPNVGDHYSSPSHYFPQLKESVSLDPAHACLPKVWRQKTVLVGGGGLIAHPAFRLNMEMLAMYRPRILIAWGIGHNVHGEAEVRYPDYLESFDLAGIRDYGTKYDWVPCASCMHPAFDRKYEITEEYVVYENKLCSAVRIGGFKRLTNEEMCLENVVAFLGSAETVLTSSYHGVYWATLLGRNVIIVNPFSTKFSGLKHKHPLTDEANWKAKRKEVRSYPEALEECREANLAFAERVFDLIG